MSDDLPVYELRLGERLTGVDWFPLQFRTLYHSDWIANASAEAFRAGILLICAAMDQDPAGTLPDDRGALARLAGLGRDVAAWDTVADGALWKWRRTRVLTGGDDMLVRLGHPVVEDTVLDMLQARNRADQRREDAAYRARLSRLRQSLKKLGCHSKMVANDALIVRVDKVLEDQRWRRTLQNVGQAFDIATSGGEVLHFSGSGGR